MARTFSMSALPKSRFVKLLLVMMPTKPSVSASWKQRSVKGQPSEYLPAPCARVVVASGR